jgi:hypothetical protein
MAALAIATISLPPARAAVDFLRDIRPILETSCVECHAYGRSQGDFSLEDRMSMLSHTSAVLPGDAGGSRLLALVRGDDPDLVMPFRGPRLSDNEVALLEAWLREGALWPEHFAFREQRSSILPRRPDPPATTTSSGAHPIDRFVGAYADARGVALEPTVTDHAFLRRASLDLVGLLPSHAQIERFVTDSDPQRRSALVRSLLSDQDAYAAHWLSFWNDLLRNDYSGTGYIDGGRKQISRWLYAALRDNLPYDRFATELVDPGPESEGFAAGIAWRGEASASQIPELQFARSVSQVFLGTNVKCASCHDSFINDWKLADTYALAAVTADRPLELHRCDKPTGEMARAGFLFPEIGDLDPEAPRAARLARFAELLTSPENGRFARTIVNRLWQRLMGRGLVEPVDDLEQPAWSADLLDYLASDLIDHGFDLKRTLETIATSVAYQRRTVAVDSQVAPEHFEFRGPTPKRLSAEQLVDALWTLSGLTPEAPDRVFQEESAGHELRVRAALVPADSLMRSLGRPNREQVVSTRPSELVTLQALELTNGQAVSEYLAAAAHRIAAGAELAGRSEREQVERIFLELLSRPPTADEAAIALSLLESGTGTAPMEDLLWVLLMHPEFQLVG